MPSLSITVEDSAGARRTYEFARSPVRIGRNALNELPLQEPYVSEWHGVIRFDDRAAAYVDHGSTNGTLVDGRRLVKNEPVPLPVQLQIGPLKLDVAWSEMSAPVPSGGTLQGSGPTAAPDERMRRVAEALCAAIVGLRKGHEQLGSEIGVRTVAGNSPLHRAQSGREVLAYLSDPTANLNARLEELNALCADLGVHQLALMEGFNQGVQTLLHGLDPRAHGLAGGAAMLLKRKQWDAYVEQFQSLLGDEQELHGRVFGEDFARAYASVAGNPNGRNER